MGKGILVAVMRMANAAPDEFNDWYDTEHMPERGRCPGFLTAMRWISTSDPHLSIAIYDLTSLGVLRSAGYLAIRGENLSPWSRRLGRKYEGVLRFEGHQIIPGDELTAECGDGIALIVTNSAAKPDEETASKLNTSLLSISGVINARGFSAGNDERRHMTICQLTTPAIVDTPAWKDAMESADRDAVKEITLIGTRYRRES